MQHGGMTLSDVEGEGGNGGYSWWGWTTMLLLRHALRRYEFMIGAPGVSLTVAPGLQVAVASVCVPGCVDGVQLRGHAWAGWWAGLQVMW